MAEWGLYGLLFGVGVLAGTLNVVAGGGSFLTLPVLILLGLPATVANGTNRVGILLQNVGAVWGFRRYGVLDARWALWRAIPPATVGAVLGTWLALIVAEEAFRKILAVLMIAMTVATLWSPAERGGGAPAGRLGSLGVALGFLVVGVYGGFVQAGVGFLILTVTTLAGLDLVRGNAIKVLCILVFTTVALAIFALDGKVAWTPGLVLGAGTVVGGQLGVRLTVLRGHAWVRGVVLVTVALFAVRLWLL